MRRFLDTNVLLYAQESTEKGAAARAVLLAGGIVSVQVLNEFAAVSRRKLRRTWDEIDAALDDIRLTLDEIRPLTDATHRAALRLSRRDGFAIYDASIVAAALEAGCDELVTEDMQHGRSVEGLRIVDPFRASA